MSMPDASVAATQTGAVAEVPPALRPWLAHLQHERRLAARTLAAYARNLTVLLRQLEQVGVEANAATDLALLRAPRLRQVVATLHRQGWSPRSLAQWLASVRSYYRFVQIEQADAIDPTRGVRVPRPARTLPEVLDVDEAQQLVELSTDGELGARDRALLEVLYGMGLRVSEVVSLRWEAVDLEAGEARILGKGARTRIAPIGAQASHALRALRVEQLSEEWVFPGRRGPLTVRAVQARLRTLARQQGIWKRVYPHLMRHSFASHVLESSGDLRGVQELLGHAQLQTTQIYTHLDFQRLAEVYDRAHPRAQRRRGKA